MSGMNDIIELQSLSNQGSLSTENASRPRSLLRRNPFLIRAVFRQRVQPLPRWFSRSQSLSNQGSLSTCLMAMPQRSISSRNPFLIRAVFRQKCRIVLEPVDLSQSLSNQGCLSTRRSLLSSLLKNKSQSLSNQGCLSTYLLTSNKKEDSVAIPF